MRRSASAGRTFGKKVKLNMLMNAKSGICPEDCGYCSQSIVSTAAIPKYSLLDEDVIVEGAREALARARPGRTASSRAAAGRAQRELRERDGGSARRSRQSCR